MPNGCRSFPDNVYWTSAPVITFRPVLLHNCLDSAARVGQHSKQPRKLRRLNGRNPKRVAQPRAYQLPFPIDFMRYETSSDTVPVQPRRATDLPGSSEP
jgi:hypothetical protein